MKIFCCYLHTAPWNQIVAVGRFPLVLKLHTVYGGCSDSCRSRWISERIKKWVKGWRLVLRCTVQHIYIYTYCMLLVWNGICKSVITNIVKKQILAEIDQNLMFIGPCIFVIVEEKQTNLMSLVIMFYFTSSMLNMFRTLINPSSGVCDFSLVSQHWSCVLVSMYVGVSVWLGWGGIRVAGWSRLLNGYLPNPATLKLQHTSKQKHTTNVVIQ